MDPAVKRTVLRLVSYGLYIVTARHGEQASGMTVNWLTQASFEPPLLAMAVETVSRTRGLIDASQAFAVNVLDSTQRDLAAQLGRSSAKSPDKFTGVEWQPGPATGSPVMPAALAWAECRLLGQMPAGDHLLYLAEVVEVGLNREGLPLTLRDGGFKYAG